MNIFIANLNFKIKSEFLQEVFEEYGTVTSAKVITDRRSGRSKGFGFVEMENEDEAQKAIDGLNGKELDGRSVVVQKAKPRNEEREES